MDPALHDWCLQSHEEGEGFRIMSLPRHVLNTSLLLPCPHSTTRASSIPHGHIPVTTACVSGKRSALNSSPGQPEQAAAAVWVNRKEPALSDSVSSHMHPVAQPALCLSLRTETEGSGFFPLALALRDSCTHFPLCSCMGTGHFLFSTPLQNLYCLICCSLG